MLHFLRRGDHHRVARAVFFGVGDHVVAFRDQVLHTLALLATHRHAEQVEHLFEALDVPFGFLQMLLDAPSRSWSFDAFFASFGSALVSCFSAS